MPRADRPSEIYNTPEHYREKVDVLAIAGRLDRPRGRIIHEQPLHIRFVYLAPRRFRLKPRGEGQHQYCDEALAMGFGSLVKLLFPFDR